MFKNGRVEIIPNDQGNRITPSYVAFTADGERLIGDAAKNQLTTNPENTVFDAKRLIGREFSESSVQHDLKYFPFKVRFHLNPSDWIPKLNDSSFRLLKRAANLTLKWRHLKESDPLLLKRSLLWS